MSNPSRTTASPPADERWPKLLLGTVLLLRALAATAGGTVHHSPAAVPLSGLHRSVKIAFFNGRSDEDAADRPLWLGLATSSTGARPVAAVVYFADLERSDSQADHAAERSGRANGIEP